MGENKKTPAIYIDRGLKKLKMGYFTTIFSGVGSVWLRPYDERCWFSEPISLSRFWFCESVRP
jgi:hypothetical protein